MKNSLKNTTSVSNSLDPDQTRQNFVGSDLDPNSLQRLSADATSRYGVNDFFLMTKLISKPTKSNYI